MRQSKEEIVRENTALKDIIEKILAFAPEPTDTVSTALAKVRALAMVEFKTERVDSARAKLVTQIVGEIAKQPMIIFETADQIGEFLNAAGLRTLRNFEWTGASVRGIIDDVRAEMMKGFSSVALESTEAPKVPSKVEVAEVFAEARAREVAQSAVASADTALAARVSTADIVSLDDELAALDDDMLADLESELIGALGSN